MMTFVERVEAFAGAFWAALGASAAGVVAWLVRTVFTNKRVAEAAQTSVRELRREIELREESRKRERQSFERLEERMDAGLEEVRRDVKTLLARHGD